MHGRDYGIACYILQEDITSGQVSKTASRILQVSTIPNKWDCLTAILRGRGGLPDRGFATGTGHRDSQIVI